MLIPLMLIFSLSQVVVFTTNLYSFGGYSIIGILYFKKVTNVI